MKVAFCMQENDIEELESNKIQRFELLRNELIELEKRVQRSADQSENEEVYPELYAQLGTIFLGTRNLAHIDSQLLGTVIQTLSGFLFLCHCALLLTGC